MAGIVMNAHHADENIDQLSSQTAASPQYMSKGSHGTALDRQSGANGTAEESESAISSRLEKRSLELNSHSTLSPNAEDLSKAPHVNGNSTAPHTTGTRKRHELGAEHHIYRYRSRAPAKTMKPLMDPRLYRNTYVEPMHSYYDKAMRRSAHRLVSATTRFDRVTNGALALLADIARMYLLRIGEACKARADLANRSEPNVYDIIDSGTSDLSVDWRSLYNWTNEWKDEVCDKTADIVQETNHKTSSSEPPVSAAKRTGLDATWLDGNSIEDIINSIDLDRLLLEDPNATNFSDEVAIPAHLPPLVSISDDESSEDQTKDALPPVAALSKDGDNADSQDGAPVPKNDTKYVNRPMSPESDGEETPESIAAHILHITSAALSTLPNSVTSNKSLYAFFRPASKPDASCAPEEILPTFDIPDVAMVETPDFIKEKLSDREKLPAGMPMFLAAASDQRDVLGDVEKQWREARVKLYENIYEDAAEMALEEMDNAPLPVRRLQTSDSEDEGKGDTDQLPHIELHEHSVEPVHTESGLDMNMDEDMMEMDLGVDLDLDIDVVNGVSDIKEENEDLRESVQKPQLQTNGNNRLHTEDTNDLQNLEEIQLPVTSGLRGSGVPNWSNEWFTAAMGKRLSQMTAHDILPCDSLYISKPLQQHVVDEMAKAYVDSEGGGHLHEKTPLAGFGPPADSLFNVPSASGSALRWTLHHLQQTRGPHAVTSLYSGRSSLAGGISGDGINQYANRMCSLIKASAEEEADLVVNSALQTDDVPEWANRKLHPPQEQLVEQLIAGAEKRIPWAQERLDIHVLESGVVGREPQPAPIKPVLLTMPSTPLASTPSGPSAASPAPEQTTLIPDSEGHILEH
ncbi:hypothetical protein LPJ55_004287 [Coemansia sp. RSA 990]|nr:hypothetical protein LPJ55_004287 [Coemansia sp. RSA 990]KAJ2677282.1 hypothetical protein IWW42_000088 [Coemansia sp. RSA 1085]